MESKSFDITWGGLWRAVLVVFLAVIIYLARDIVVAFFLAIVISAAFDAPVSFLERKKIPRILGTLIVYIVVILALAMILYTAVPLALSEFNDLLAKLNQYSGTIADFLKSSGIIESLSKGINKLTDTLISGGISLAALGSSLFGGILMIGATFVLSFYLTIGKDGVERFLRAILPRTYEESVLTIYSKVKQRIGRWLKGQLILSVVIGVLVFLGLWLLGVRYSLILGILAGILELIPYAGPILSGGVAVLVGLSESLSLGIYVLLLFIIIQQLENNVFMPIVMRFTVDLNPAVVLIALLIGAKIFGFIGIILAVPVAVLVQEIIEDRAQSKHRRVDLGV